MSVDATVRTLISRSSTAAKTGTQRPTDSGFPSFHLRHELLQALTAAGFEEPRPIQAKTITPALRGRDVLGLAQTGTGKTAAFALPILHNLLMSHGQGPRALVVTPTRELAAQVHSEFERLGKFTRLRSTPIFGGVPIPRQQRALRENPDVIVACPGRLLDLVKQRALRLDRIEVLVLDEADHMFDMGFLPDLRRILDLLPKRRQNLLFSATMPREIRKLADQVLREPVVVELGDSKPAETIEHVLCPMVEGDKAGAARKLLSGPDFESAIVFLRTKHRAKRLAMKLAADGHDAVALQGNMSQSQRERALAGFRKGTYDVLVATDIAARGLDIEGVSHVINFDVPNTPDAYTHRIGRTGRSGKSGRAFTFVTPDDAAQVKDIEKRIGAPIERRKLDGVSGSHHSRASDTTGSNGPARRSRGARSNGAVARSTPERVGAGARRSASDGEAPTRSRGRGKRASLGQPAREASTPPKPATNATPKTNDAPRRRPVSVAFGQGL